MCLQLLMELQKVALRADEDVGPVRQTLSTFAGQLSNVVDKQLQVSSHMPPTLLPSGFFSKVALTLLVGRQEGHLA